MALVSDSFWRCASVKMHRGKKNRGGGGRLIHLVVMRRVVGDGETQRRRMEGDGKGRVGEVSDRGSDE